MTIAAEPRSGRLPQLGLLRFTGADSLSFLQGQLSNDTRRLEEARTLFAAYSTPQGRVLALLHLVPHSSGVLGVLPRELAAPTMDALRRFVLRAKVKIEDASELLWVAGAHGSRRLAERGIAIPSPDRGYAEDQGLGVASVNRDPGRYWVIGAPEQLQEYALAGDGAPADTVEGDWRLADIRAGLPQIYAATREAFVAQMLNLDLLDGISFGKGCYTGQEIIARTQHLGRIKRRLYRLRLPPGDWSVGQALQLTDGRAGRLVEVAQAGGAVEALAVLNVEASASSDHESPASSAVAAAQLPLPYALP